MTAVSIRPAALIAISLIALLMNRAQAQTNAVVIEKLKIQKFDCRPAENKGGTICTGDWAQWSTGKIAVYVGPDAQVKPSAVDFHFRGLRGYIPAAASIEKDAYSMMNNVTSKLKNSNALVVLPFADTSGTAETMTFVPQIPGFLAYLEKTTGVKKPELVLSAHSGGINVLDRAMRTPSLAGKIADVIAMDPNPYGSVPQYSEWQKLNPNTKRFCFHKSISNGTSLPNCQAMVGSDGTRKVIQTGNHYLVATEGMSQGLELIAPDSTPTKVEASSTHSTQQ